MMPLEEVTYTCPECGMTVKFFAGFTMVCKGWDRHVFNMGGQ